MTIPLAASLVLAGISFSTSVFVILRIVLPILPPHPLSKRVSPSEFGLPRFLKLSTADKCHLWLAGLDAVALALHIWQVVDESLNGLKGFAAALDPMSTVRLWTLVTLRQTCLMVIAALILLHLRMAQSMALGRIHWMIWSPVILLTITSATIAGLLAGTGFDYLFHGLVAYYSTIAILTTAALFCLLRTLVIVKRNLAALDEATNSWPPPEIKTRPSFATEDIIDAIKDGSSWITSETGSHKRSVSAWSFSTQQTTTTQSKSQSKSKRPSFLTRSSISTGLRAKVPLVPTLPSPYSSAPSTPAVLDNSDPDPFRRNPPHPDHPRQRFGSQSSWLTSTAGSHTTVTKWSLPTTNIDGPSIRYEDSLRIPTPDARTLYSPSPGGFVDARSLSGYGYPPSLTEFPREEKGTAASIEELHLLNVSYFSAIGWSLIIWLPFLCLLPYLVYLSQRLTPPTSVHIFYILSVTISSPLLTLNLLLKCPLPIPVGLFDSKPKPTIEPQSINMAESFPPFKWPRETRQSSATSVTVVEGRLRSGDVWITQGDAVDGRGKFGRAVSMLSTTPKLSVLPLEDVGSVRTPSSLSTRDDYVANRCATPIPDTNSRFSRCRSESRCESRNSTVDEHATLGSKIMVAQRHYSTLAQTVVVPPSPGNSSTTVTPNTPTAASTGAKRSKAGSHIRSRSINALSPPTFSDRAQSCPSPPPLFPLPPTPPKVRAARLAMLSHKKSFSCSASPGGTSSISCRFQSPPPATPPLLLPRKKIGDEDASVDDVFREPSRKKDEKKVEKTLGEIDDGLSSRTHSITHNLGSSQETHKRNQCSLPRLDKEKLQSLAAWSSDVRRALDEELSSNIGGLNGVVDNPSSRFLTPFKGLNVVKREERSLANRPLRREQGLSVDAPVPCNLARNSASLVDVPRSVTSSVTLFEDFEGGLRAAPHAHSTPRSSVSGRRNPCPRTPTPLPSHQRSQSTVRYINSESSQYRKYSLGSPQGDLAIGPNVARRGVRPTVPLVPQAGVNIGKNNVPSKGLRPLTLLADRANFDNGLSTPKKVLIKPLVIGKRQDRVRAQVQTDENGSPSRNKHLRKVTVGHSDSVKRRGALRQNEFLPAVVVRPPSEGSEDRPYFFNYRESD